MLIQSVLVWIMVPMMWFLFSYFSDQEARTIHCSNKPIGFQNWPSGIALGFGNSPPETPMAKVIGGKSKFEDIIK